MLNAIIIWIAKQLAGYALGKLAKHLGVDEATAHVEDVLSKYTPLPEDENPSPAQLRKPKAPWL